MRKLEIHEVGGLVELSRQLQNMLCRRRITHSQDKPLKNTLPIKSVNGACSLVSALGNNIESDNIVAF